MTSKQLGYVELEWVCPNCETRNPGPVKTCRSCGAPQPADVQFEQAQNEQLITDPNRIEEAQVGPDIHCPYCSARNPGSAAVCSNCGGDLKTGAKRAAGRVVGAHKTESEPVLQVTCPNCATLNPDTNSTCSACGARLTPAASVQEPAEIAPPAAKKGRNITVLVAGFVIGLLVVCAMAFLIYNASRRNSLEARVQDVQWMRSIAIQELRDVDREDWAENIPVGAQVGACELREHHTQPEPAANSNEVCGTPYTKDTGSGYGEVVQDCSYVVSQDYCQYTVTEWQSIDKVELSGHDLNPSWPAIELSSGQRQGDQSEVYTIVFVTDTSDYQYSATDPAQFQQFTPGSEWVLVLNGFDQIVEVQEK